AGGGSGRAGRAGRAGRVGRVAGGALMVAAVGVGAVPVWLPRSGLRGAEPLLLHVAGDAQHDDAAERPMTAGTVFDLASLTKVVATMPCVLHLVGRGEIGLDEPARRYPPALPGPRKDRAAPPRLL